jgi:hypothetical protein
LHTDFQIARQSSISLFLQKDFRKYALIESKQYQNIPREEYFTLTDNLKEFIDENSHDLGAVNLFSTGNTAHANEKAIEFLKQLIKAMSETKAREITLSDSFELLFKIVENDNDTGWVEKLSNVGSEGTDTLC